mmetsp:Transcript_31706/g.97057  ORF Transcript_31706/g.97057 Transcript_31706/m.97057 type:complete len:238 (+) Transcript_31706:1714-2427(+)
MASRSSFAFGTFANVAAGTSLSIACNKRCALRACCARVDQSREHSRQNPRASDSAVLARTASRRVWSPASSERSDETTESKARGRRRESAAAKAAEAAPVASAFASLCSSSTCLEDSALAFSAVIADVSFHRTMTESAEPDTRCTKPNPSAPPASVFPPRFPAPSSPAGDSETRASKASRAHTLSSWASRVETHSDDLMLQSFTSPSDPEEATRVPARRKRTLSTEETCPSKVRRQE